MKSAAICYDSYHGHCADIARRIANEWKSAGYRTEVHAVTEDEPVAIATFDAIVVVAPVHVGRHSKNLQRFVSRYRLALDLVPTLFLSVSLAAGGTWSQRDDAQRVMEKFLAQTLWEPTLADIVAGDLAYRRYTWLTRWLMRWMAWRSGGETDVGQNHVYTDWPLLNERIQDFIDLVEPDDPAETTDKVSVGSRVMS